MKVTLPKHSDYPLVQVSVETEDGEYKMVFDKSHTEADVPDDSIATYCFLTAAGVPGTDPVELYWPPIDAEFDEEEEKDDAAA